MTCVEMKNYPITRKAPPYVAKGCVGETKKGLDGKMYTSKKVGKSVRWMKNETVASLKKKCKEQGLVYDTKTKKCRKPKKGGKKRLKVSKSPKSEVIYHTPNSYLLHNKPKSPEKNSKPKSPKRNNILPPPHYGYKLARYIREGKIKSYNELSENDIKLLKEIGIRNPKSLFPTGFDVTAQRKNKKDNRFISMFEKKRKY